MFVCWNRFNQEWKTVNSFHVQVRCKIPVSEKYAKMSLQLYQVDYKSYLLDFKSLNSEENEQGPSETVVLVTFSALFFHEENEFEIMVLIRYSILS